MKAVKKKKKKEIYKAPRCHIGSPLMVATFYLFINILVLFAEAGFILCKLKHLLPKFSSSSLPACLPPFLGPVRHRDTIWFRFLVGLRDGVAVSWPSVTCLCKMYVSILALVFSRAVWTFWGVKWDARQCNPACFSRTSLVLAGW